MSLGNVSRPAEELFKVRLSPRRQKDLYVVMLTRSISCDTLTKRQRCSTFQNHKTSDARHNRTSLAASAAPDPHLPLPQPAPPPPCNCQQPALWATATKPAPPEAAATAADDVIQSQPHPHPPHAHPHPHHHHHNRINREVLSCDLRFQIPKVTVLETSCV